MGHPLADPGGGGSDDEDDDGGLILAVAKTTAAEKCRQRGPHVLVAPTVVPRNRRASRLQAPPVSPRMLFALPAPASHACVYECEVSVCV
jgi:hypothetical protein